MTVTVSDILAIALLCSAVATIIVFASVMYSSRINDNKNDSDEDDQE